MLPPPDEEGGEDVTDGTDAAQDADDEPDVPWAGEGYERSDEPGQHGGAIWIGVLPDNVGIVEVFHRCQPQIGIGMGVVWQGVGAMEVHAACLMSHVPRRDWPRYLDGVQLMAQEVADVRNAKEAKRAKRGGKE